MRSLLLIVVSAVLFGTMSPRLALSQVTGDSYVDARLSEFPFQRTGGNSMPPTLGPGSYPNDIKDCNWPSSPTAPIDELNCPSDLLYTPNANTGGYQAFGVGIRNLPGGTYYYSACYPVPFYDIEYTYIYYWCVWYSIAIPAMTYGVAAAHIKFGSGSTSSPWSLKPMSTLAFKANTIYLPYNGNVKCDTDYNPLAAQAPCDDDDVNVYAVEDAGYEDKILITDYGCSGTRTGSGIDAEHGCFVQDDISPSNWYSNLPAVYPDTTFLDPLDSFQPGFGSADPEAIIEGVSYIWYTGFYQYGWESMADKVLLHKSSVTVNVDPNPAGCNSSEPWDCYYQVDQTTIAPPAQISP